MPVLERANIISLDTDFNSPTHDASVYVTVFEECCNIIFHLPVHWGPVHWDYLVACDTDVQLLKQPTGMPVQQDSTVPSLSQKTCVHNKRKKNLPINTVHRDLHCAQQCSTADLFHDGNVAPSPLPLKSSKYPVEHIICKALYSVL